MSNQLFASLVMLRTGASEILASVLHPSHAIGDPWSRGLVLGNTFAALEQKVLMKEAETWNEAERWKEAEISGGECCSCGQVRYREPFVVYLLGVLG